MTLRLFSLVLLVFLLPLVATAQDTWYAVPLAELEVVDGERPTPAAFQAPRWLWVDDSLEPYVVLDGPGEAYVLYQAGSSWGRRRGEPTLMVRAPQGAGVSGLLVFPRGENPAGRVRFEVDAERADPEGESRFLQARADHYARLMERGAAGSAWFRYQKDQALSGLPASARTQWRRGRRWDRDDMGETLELFAGGRAVSENLQLDRSLPDDPRGADRQVSSVPVSAISGITVAELDWAPHLEGLQIDPDPLAKLVPADQYAFFFPSTRALLRVVEAADEEGTPLLFWASRRVEDAGTRARYERQLGVPLNRMIAVMGERIVSSMVLTGSDPYLRTGTDVAMLFESPDPATLRQLLDAARKMTTATVHGVTKRSEEIGGVAVSVLASPQREVSSYLAEVDSRVILSNSPVQMRKIIAATRGESPAMADLDEYRFFRGRYQRSDASESGLLVITDPAIRRWCGPKWRIGASRRIRAAAELSDLHAQHARRLLGEADDEGIPLSVRPEIDLGSLHLDRGRIRSSIYNTLDFQTPIAELDLAMVTTTEKQLYERWRNGYQANWTQGFDPIAARIVLDKKRIHLDLTVMPLIVSSEYRDFVDVATGSEIRPGDGDPHAESLLHFVLAVDRDSKEVKEIGNFMGKGFMGAGFHPLSWLGSSISVYVDEDAFFEQMLQAEDMEEFLEENFPRIPVALHCEVADPLRLSLFLNGLRARVEATAPDTVEWTSLKHGEHAYVMIGPSSRESWSEPFNELRIYYAIVGSSLVITLNEPLLFRAIERAQAAEGTETRPAAPPKPWPGKHLAFRMDLGQLRVAERLLSEGRDPELRARARSWSNLPILNEWKRLFPERDPVQVHQELWGTRLVCPVGGRYVWNPEWQTMASTATGHPGEPRKLDQPTLPLQGWKEAAFGLTFENDGIRATAELNR